MTETEPEPSVFSIQVGQVAPLGPQHVQSGFVKRGIPGPVRVRTLGLEGDAQADLSVHGGPEKAVYAYPLALYDDWLRDFPEHAPRLLPGAFGENLTIKGLTETSLCAGDVHAIGSARLQVCQPRQPCFKFALRFEDNRMPKAMVRTGRSGWYYRVLEEGMITAGDTVRLVDRPNPALPFEAMIRVLYRGEARAEEIAAIAEAAGIARWFRLAAGQALRDRG